MTENGNIVLIDGHSQVYRAYHGMPALTNSKGELISVLYAMARFLLALDESYPHQYGAVIFDKGPPRKRLEVLPEYKAQRPSMPEELRSQLPAVREWIQAAGWPLLEEEGREADDLIAAIVKARRQHPVYIVSHDKDLGQLVREDVVQLIPDKSGAKARLKELNAAAIKEKFGVEPEAIVDYLAMVGDSSDNIPGLPGVGPKTAVELLQHFGNIDSILRRKEEIEKPSLRKKLDGAGELLKKNRELVRLDDIEPADWDGLSGLKRRCPDWARLRRFAEENDFKSLLPVIEEGEKADRSPKLL